jgi:alkaline phosphatase
VTTSRITHATPASFYSHVVDRDLESDIAEFLVGKRAGFNQGRTVDLAFGGGKCFFIGNQTQPSCRNDTKNLLEGINDEFRIVEGMKGLREWKDEELEQSARNGKKSVLGLFANDVST